MQSRFAWSAARPAPPSAACGACMRPCRSLSPKGCSRLPGWHGGTLSSRSACGAAHGRSRRRRRSRVTCSRHERCRGRGATAAAPRPCGIAETAQCRPLEQRPACTVPGLRRGEGGDGAPAARRRCQRGRGARVTPLMKAGRRRAAAAWTLQESIPPSCGPLLLCGALSSAAASLVAECAHHRRIFQAPLSGPIMVWQYGCAL
mmetsp:Transcript_43185/g.128985  ORF Transcript_43185/g.128985 Transcript_43185/m.128985 type:complete len:203 (-) Transcript_43185:246-854(-)